MAAGVVRVLLLAAVIGSEASVLAASDDRHEIPAVEAWRRGGDDDDLFFGLVTDVVGDAEGRVYLLDTHRAHVVVLDRDGRFVRTLGREGDGPGELRRPHACFWMPDGSLGLLQGFPGRVVTRDRNDVPGPDLRPRSDGGGAVLATYGVAPVAEGIVAACSWPRDATPGAFDYVLAEYALDGRPRSVLWRCPTPPPLHVAPFVEVADSLPSRDRWDVSPRGVVAHAPRLDRYLVRLHRPGGDVAIIERRGPARPRTEPELLAAGEPFEIFRSRNGQRVRHELMDHAPPVVSVDFDADGCLWVRGSRSDPPHGPDGGRTWDVYAPDGAPLGSISIAWPDARSDDRTTFLPGRRLLVVRGADDAVARTIPEKREDVPEDALLQVLCLDLGWMPVDIAAAAPRTALLQEGSPDGAAPFMFRHSSADDNDAATQNPAAIRKTSR